MSCSSRLPCAASASSSNRLSDLLRRRVDCLSCCRASCYSSGMLATASATNATILASASHCAGSSSWQ
ncbi:unnamed protein product [Sphagnum compactum]